jgi:hypothetical protein
MCLREADGSANCGTMPCLPESIRDLGLDELRQQSERFLATYDDAETENPPELQRTGWQAILDNFGRHVEAKG